MGNNRKMGIVVWMLMFLLSIFLLLIIPSIITGAIYVTLVFDVITFVSTLMMWLYFLKNIKTPKETFLSTPAITVSAIYLTIQFLLCIVVGILGHMITVKVALILNVILLAVMWILIFSALSTGGYIKRVDSRQKDHYIKL